MSTQDVLKRQRELFSRSVNEWVKDRALCRVTNPAFDRSLFLQKLNAL